jgi:nitroimidazol reductase NimA-like FMN-containing flavoprotein (pyridoxamine 5'-phosphate oxidase superfamily)
MNDHAPPPLTATDRTRLKRMPKRGVFDREAVYRILDEGFVCHVAFVVDDQPYAIPTGYARVGDSLYLHGSAASRMLKSLGAGMPVCVTVTLVDGLVLARSAFHHSVNYRSVVVLGQARMVTDPMEKAGALRAFTNHVVPGRWEELRPVTAQELLGTAVLVLPIEEASAKVRTGPPIDDEEDLSWPVWAGVVPLGLRSGPPVPDAHVRPGLAPPDASRLIRAADAAADSATDAQMRG